MGGNILTKFNKNIKNIESGLEYFFNPIFDITDCPVYLLGGALKNFLLNKSEIPKDLDFVLLTEDLSIISSFISNNEFKYTKNSFGGYKISFNNTIIDIWITNDLYKAIKFNTDGLFYDIQNKILLPFGCIESLETKKLEIINNKNTHPLKSREYEHETKAEKFILSKI